MANNSYIVILIGLSVKAFSFLFVTGKQHDAHNVYLLIAITVSPPQSSVTPKYLYIFLATYERRLLLIPVQFRANKCKCSIALMDSAIERYMGTIDSNPSRKIFSCIFTLQYRVLLFSIQYLYAVFCCNHYLASASKHNKERKREGHKLSSD